MYQVLVASEVTGLLTLGHLARDSITVCIIPPFLNLGGSDDQYCYRVAFHARGGREKTTHETMGGPLGGICRGIGGFERELTVDLASPKCTSRCADFPDRAVHFWYKWYNI